MIEADRNCSVVVNGVTMTCREYSEFQRNEYMRLRDRDLAEIRALQSRRAKGDAERKARADERARVLALVNRYADADAIVALGAVCAYLRRGQP